MGALKNPFENNRLPTEDLRPRRPIIFTRILALTQFRKIQRALSEQSDIRYFDAEPFGSRRNGLFHIVRSPCSVFEVNTSKKPLDFVLTLTITSKGDFMTNRCGWVKMTNPLYVDYHDKEWGIPLHDERKLFELLCLETYQAGLSWETILNKRAAFNQAFHDYDYHKVAKMTDEDLEMILENPAIVRNRLKIFATRANAQAFLKVQEAFGSFDAYIWSFVDGQPIVNTVHDYREAPAKTVLSERISKDLKKRGFKFTGPVAIYSYLQAAGLINDHEESCAYK